MGNNDAAAQDGIQPKPGAPEEPSGITDAIEAGMERFGEGHPAEAAVWDEGEEEGGEAAAAGEGAAGEGAPSAAEPPAAGGEAAAPKEGRFESQDAAEEGYRNLQAKHTKAEQELARYREAERKRQEEAARAEQGKAFADQVREFSKEKNAEALQKIDDLDPDDFDDDAAYNARVAEIWADKDSEVAAFMHTRPAAGESPAGEETPAGTGEAPAGEEASAGAQTTWDDVVATAQAQDQGFDTQDPAFISYCRMAPKEGEDGKELPFEDQVAWAVNQTKDYHQRLVRGTAAERSEGHQRRNAPLGRGGSPPGGRGGAGGQGAPRPVSLDDAVTGALESRRL